ncbi:MAG TPA: hypothetical protein VK941_11920 [Gillisia sp.]|nr:hypothetical protein [Gillisia sp.]
MKKIFLSLLALMIGVVSFAQEQKRERKQMHKQERVERSAEEMASLRTERMAAQLSLTDVQKEKINSLFLEQAKERKTTMAEAREKREMKKGNKEDRKREMEARMENRKEMQEQLKTVLTPAQYEEWQASRETKDRKRAYGKQKGKSTK